MSIKKYTIYQKLLSLTLVFCLVLPLFGCQREPDPQPATEVERLSKLCRVWGYVKYTHPAFLLGERDWDGDLLALIPQVRELETHEEVNALLHQWFADLGEIDYGTDEPVAFWTEAAEADRLVIVDTSWTTDANYLGEDLAGDLGRLGEVPAISRRKAPVKFMVQNGIDVTYPDFKNEALYPDMDFASEEYRLLGLFRAWNVLEYYFPYHDLLEEDWGDCLDELIPAMLEGSDRDSYQMTILTLLAKLHDNHVYMDGKPYSTPSGMAGAEGAYGPVSVAEAEGKLVVSAAPEGCPLKRGDVILRVNGASVEDAAQLLKAYFPCSREEIFLSRYAGPILAAVGIGDPQAEVTILRDGTEETVLCESVSVSAGGERPQEDYLILEGNIGLINPANLQVRASMMEELRDTEGLIVDLRQYPTFGLFDFSSYFTTEYAPIFIDASPSGAVPGAYVKEVHRAGYQPGDERRGVYHYDKPVVVLVDEFTQSAGEWAAWSLGKGENVVLMGQNTSGALNRIGNAPLPGGFWFTFTAVRAQLDNGGQLQRVGLTPDISVARTIEGIKEGRDELMEAAAAYIVRCNV